MYAATMLSPQNDAFFVGRRILALVRDPNSNASRISRLIELAPALGEAVMDSAEVHFQGRGPIQSVAHAITLIGYRRLDRVVRQFLRGEYLRIEAEGDTVYQLDWSHETEKSTPPPVAEFPLDLQ